MTLLSSHHATACARLRRRAVPRSTAVVAVLVTIIGAPLVAHAVVSEGATAGPTRATAALDQPDLDQPAPDHVSIDDAPLEHRRSAAPDARTQEPAAEEAVAEPVAEEADAEPLDIHALLTDPYTWDERSLRVAALQQVLQVDVDGWYDADTRLVHLEFLQFAALGTDGVPEVAPPGPSADEWAALRDCESGGDYSIVSSSGRYRGAYQFARTTWDSVAERNNPALVGVDPAAATSAEQDAMASALYREAGSGPWPVCGRHLS